MAKKRQLLCNSTAEFPIFTSQAGEQSIEARYEDETIGLSQKLMAMLFDVGVNTINYHRKEASDSGEIQPASTIRKFRIVQQEGSRQVAREVDFYNLDAIISVGYLVNSSGPRNSAMGTQALREFASKGYVLDKQRVENGSFLGEDYNSKEEYNGCWLGRSSICLGCVLLAINRGHCIHGKQVK